MSISSLQEMMSAGQRRRLSNPDGRAHQLYESGDVVQALQIYSRLIEQLDYDENESMARQHNMALLTYLVNAQSSNEQAFLTALKDMHSEMKKSNRFTIEMLVVSHNLALNYLVKNQPENGFRLLLPLFEAFSDTDEERLDDMKCKVCFLLIDCILALFQTNQVEEIFEWLELLISKKSSEDMDSIMEMKFRFHCYKSRYLFIQSNYSNSSDLDKLTRMAKKELKNAMEIYHNELASKVVDRDKHSTIKTDGQDGTASVQDSIADTVGSVPNEQNRDIVTLAHNTMLNEGESNDSRTPTESRSSDALNRHALYLKADLEHLKGNTKKALKLCSEAEIHIDRQNEDSTNEVTSLFLQAALHNNNIAVVHQAAGHLYLAMHYYSHAIEFMKKTGSETQGLTFDLDGTILQIPVAQIFYNAAVCAQNVNNFNSAYECMSSCIEVSPDVFAQIPSTWLLLGESCIGLMQSKAAEKSNWWTETRQTIVKYPVLKGIECLNNCISLCIRKPNEYISCLESARVALAYIWMEAGNPVSALRLANEVLNEPVMKKEMDDEDVMLSNQRRATMRLYASEAMCLIGDAYSGFKFLSNGFQEEDIMSHMKTLAKYLASKDGNTKTDDESQTFIHLKNQLSVASAYALMGDTFSAKQISSNLLNESADAEIISSAKSILRFCALVEQNKTRA